MLVIAFHDDAGRGTHDVTVTVSGEGDPATDLRFVGACSATIDGDPEAACRWNLEPLTLTPHLDRVGVGRLIDVYAYRTTDIADVAAFDLRISERYTELCEVFGEYYAGPYTCAELGSPWVVEVVTYRSDVPAEADALVDGALVTDELQAIVDECRTLQCPTTRYVVRLAPR
jgi:hypothetical protein